MYFISDTEILYQKTFQEQLSKYGKTYSDELRAKVMGTTEKDSIHTFVTDLNLPVTEEEFQRESKKLQLAVLSECGLMPGLFYLLLFFFFYWLMIKLCNCRLN